ncbi:translation elongation factor EF1B gamma SCDLUD_001964 [Saccharomycodes ludwigii]|uniref:translation elongation factor EF1B gamma n=1 Tax=Saccharomycodes ludwigii TaxID=36035 RepID=UPI001E868874|nr:hypothetical protein SCDLUD_001964 [Saccharomycodes ludwigii]KAH3902151.1 hypothetical protein SCDLUD_001964 [Saccharomycodes ludwigii]
MSETRRILYANQRVRPRVPIALVKKFNLPVEIIDPEDKEFNDGGIYAKFFPLKKVPSYIELDKNTNEPIFILTEVIAVIFYLLETFIDENSSSPELLAFAKSLIEPDSTTTLNKIQYKSSILKWLSLTNSDFLITLVGVFNPLRGVVPYNKESVDSNAVKVDKIVSEIFVPALSSNKYLLGKKITIADFFAVACFTRGFDYVFGKEWMAKYPVIVNWFNDVRKQDGFLVDFYKDFEFIEKPLEPPVKN